MQNLINEIKKELGTKIFSVTFIKKDGTIRDMTCRLGVTKHLKGGELSHDPNELGHLIVFDMKKESYRTINLNTITRIKFENKEYYF
jgi:hypothetical protein